MLYPVFYDKIKNMMNELELMTIISENLVYYRKAHNLTQLQVAEKLNYSDKSVSKWERAEGLPDIYTLYLIAGLYGVSLNDLIRKKKTIKTKRIKPKVLITLIALGICWLVATIAFGVMGIFWPNFNLAWLSFIYAIPVSMIVIIIFSEMWRNILFAFLALSVLIWSIPLSIYLSLQYDNLWLLFICIIPLQIIVILWFILRHTLKKEKRR